NEVSDQARLCRGEITEVNGHEVSFLDMTFDSLLKIAEIPLLIEVLRRKGTNCIVGAPFLVEPVRPLAPGPTYQLCIEHLFEGRGDVGFRLVELPPLGWVKPELAQTLRFDDSGRFGCLSRQLRLDLRCLDSI